MRRLAAILTLALAATTARAFSPMAMQDLFWASAAAGYPSDALVMRFEMDAGQWLVLPLITAYTYDFTVDYGDGGDLKTITAYNDADISNQYAEAGTYDVVMRGTVGRWYFNNGGNKADLIEVVQFGSPNPTATFLNNSFFGCSNLTSSAELGSAFSAVSGLSYTWSACYSITNLPEVNHLTDVTTLASAWSTCSKAANFPDVNALTKVTTLASTWYAGQATAFPDVNNLTNVITLNSTWRFCTMAKTFPPVSNLSKVTTLYATWNGCTAATNLPEVGALINVTDVGYTWVNCTGALNFPAVNTLTKVTNLMSAWSGCSLANSFPAVDALTNVVTLASAWYGCAGATNFPSVAALTNVTSLSGTWLSGINNSNMPTLFVSNAVLTNCYRMLYNNYRMGGSAPIWWGGDGLPDPAKFPALVNYAQAYNGCTNLSNYADIPAGWK